MHYSRKIADRALRASSKTLHPASAHAPARTLIRYFPIFRIKGRSLVFGKTRYNCTIQIATSKSSFLNTYCSQKSIIRHCHFMISHCCVLGKTLARPRISKTHVDWVRRHITRVANPPTGSRILLLWRVKLLLIISYSVGGKIYFRAQASYFSYFLLLLKHPTSKFFEFPTPFFGYNKNLLLSNFENLATLILMYSSMQLHF